MIVLVVAEWWLRGSIQGYLMPVIIVIGIGYLNQIDIQNWATFVGSRIQRILQPRRTLTSIAIRIWHNVLSFLGQYFALVVSSTRQSVGTRRVNQLLAVTMGGPVGLSIIIHLVSDPWAVIWIVYRGSAGEIRLCLRVVFCRSNETRVNYVDFLVVFLLLECVVVLIPVTWDLWVLNAIILWIIAVLRRGLHLLINNL